MLKEELSYRDTAWRLHITYILCVQKSFIARFEFCNKFIHLCLALFVGAQWDTLHYASKISTKCFLKMIDPSISMFSSVLSEKMHFDGVRG